MLETCGQMVYRIHRAGECDIAKRVSERVRLCRSGTVGIRGAGIRTRIGLTRVYAVGMSVAKSRLRQHRPVGNLQSPDIRPSTSPIAVPGADNKHIEINRPYAV